MRDQYAAPRTSLQCACTQRRNCIEQLSPSLEYAPPNRTFSSRNLATIKLTHGPAVSIHSRSTLGKAPRDRLAIGFNPEAMRDVAGRPSPRGSRRRVLFGSACCAVGGAMFGNQFQGRIFVGTSADALPISVDDPLMTNVLDCIFCHCGSTVRPPARLALA